MDQLALSKLYKVSLVDVVSSLTSSTYDIQIQRPFSKHTEVINMATPLSTSVNQTLISALKQPVDLQTDTVLELKKLNTAQSTIQHLLLRSNIFPGFMCFIKLALVSTGFYSPSTRCCTLTTEQELREKVWLATLPGPRVINATWLRTFDDNSEECEVPILISSAKQPVTLHVCRESRQIALRTLSGRLSVFYGQQREIPFEPEVDIVYLMYNSAEEDGYN